MPKHFVIVICPQHEDTLNTQKFLPNSKRKGSVTLSPGLTNFFINLEPRKNTHTNTHTQTHTYTNTHTNTHTHRMRKDSRLI